MRALILTDRAFAKRERSMLSRLEVGLADEGVRVLHASPQSAGVREAGAGAGNAGEGAPAVYSTALTYADRGLPLTHSIRAAALLESIALAAPPDAGEGLLDLVHVFGEGAWPEALAAARRARARLLVEVWRGGLIPRAVTLATKAAHTRVPIRLLVPDPALAQALAARVGTAQVTAVPWGVHIPSTVHSAWESSRTLTVALTASGAEPRAVQAAIAGLGLAVARLPNMLVFVDADAADRMPIWKWARAAGLGERLSVIAEMEGRRELVLQADVLLHPEAAGEHRSLLLDALAAGVSVIARADPLNRALVDAQTACLLSEASPQAWSDALVALASDPAREAVLAASARTFIQQNHLASKSIRQVLAVYDAMMAAPASPAAPVGASA